MDHRSRKAAVDAGFLSHSLVLGSIAGTKIRLHWTFLVYLLWLGAGFLLSMSAGAALSGVAFVVAVFACVVAHEFGHILMARQFGIASPHVTLLPIGGVARLQAMPERPGQELAVALAGPVVNLAIAALLIAALGPQDISPDFAEVFAPRDILPALAAINLFLALFNLLPAFPMDGGRVLRALLALFFERAKATRIAARVGQALAIGLGLLGLQDGHVVLMLIALFVFFAADAEAREVALHRLAARLRVADATVTELATLESSDTLEEATRLLLRTDQHEIPILDNLELAGVLTREGLIDGLAARGSSSLVAEAMLTDLPTVPAESPLDEALELMESNAQPIVVLDGNGRLAGLLTRENLAELLLFASARSSGKSARTRLGRKAIAAH